MTGRDTGANWIDAVEGLSNLEAAHRAPLVGASRIVRLPAGSVVFSPGKAPEALVLLLDGTVRVHQTSEQGREIVLYRIMAGESCVLTTACLMAHDEYHASAVAETDVVAAAVPRAVFDDLMARSASFRTFVFTAFSRRMTDIFRIVEEVAFARLDVRLSQKLLYLAGDARSLRVTHQQLAIELGTAREVISRQLQEFHRRGWVGGSRGEVEILNRAGLEHLATSA